MTPCTHVMESRDLLNRIPVMSGSVTSSVLIPEEVYSSRPLFGLAEDGVNDPLTALVVVEQVKVLFCLTSQKHPSMTLVVHLLRCASGQA